MEDDDERGGRFNSGHVDAARNSELCNHILSIIGGWKNDCKLLAKTTDEWLLLGVAAEAIGETEANIREQLTKEGINILDKSDGSPSLQAYIRAHVEKTAEAQAEEAERRAQLNGAAAKVEQQVIALEKAHATQQTPPAPTWVHAETPSIEKTPDTPSRSR